MREELADTIQIGCLVEVPFHNAVDYAIVTSLESTEIPDNPKSIVRVVTKIPLLAPYQIQTLFQCSSYYFVHAHQILSLFLSKTLVRYLEKKDFINLQKTSSPSGRGLRWGLWWAGNKNPIQFYHHTSDVPFFEMIQKHIKGKTVIIFSDDFAINAYIKSFPVDENTLVVPDALTETKKHKTYFSIYNGEKNIIIWTRRILYYNLSHYENILYIEDVLHKTAMRFNHTYQHLEILRKIALHSDFRITILSTLPSIESMYLLHTGTYQKLEMK